jgi:hypothetical protein
MTRGRPSPIRHDVAGRRAELPSIVDLLVDPELAPLALLDAAANVLIQALVAANPEMLHCAEPPTTALEPVVLDAYRVISACRDLHEALDTYRARVRDCRMRGDAADDDIPF